MAASFPSAPTLDQTYTYVDHTWKWNGSAWQSVGTAQGLTGPQGTTGSYLVYDTQPVSPATGTAWLNTADGRLYVYDGTVWFEPYDNLVGIQGPTGIQGAQGVQGRQGTQGFGFAQLQGTQGTTGASPSVGKIIAMAIVFGG